MKAKVNSSTTTHPTTPHCNRLIVGINYGSMNPSHNPSNMYQFPNKTKITSTRNPKLRIESS